MTTDTSPMDHGATTFLMVDRQDDLTLRGHLMLARTRLGQASAGMGPLAWIGVRSVVLITVSMLAILVGLPAALVAAGN